MDSMAANYKSTATVDDSSCVAEGTPGCMDSMNLCFNSAATYSNGDCLADGCVPTSGCTDATASNYNSAATVCAPSNSDICPYKL